MALHQTGCCTNQVGVVQITSIPPGASLGFDAVKGKNRHRKRSQRGENVYTCLGSKQYANPFEAMEKMMTSADGARASTNDLRHQKLNTKPMLFRNRTLSNQRKSECSSMVQKSDVRSARQTEPNKKNRQQDKSPSEIQNRESK